MTTVLDPHHRLKRQVGLATLLAIGLISGIAMIIHSPQPQAHLIDKVLPPILTASCVVLFLWLYRRPAAQDRLLASIPVLFALPLVIPSWIFTLEAFASPETQLIDSYPPLATPLFLWTTVTLIFIQSRYLVPFVGLGWLVGATPVLVYLGLHPQELRALRGLDLFISLGPAMIIQAAMVLFYARLQVLVDRLYTERLQYYSQVIEAQVIRQQAMEQAYTQFHNGPLQSLAVLLRTVQQQEMPTSELVQRLTQLNAEIRAVGQSLIASPPATAQSATRDVLAVQSPILRLGSGACVDLSLPLHNLLHEVYAATLRRDLPCFKTIRLRVRDFMPCGSMALTFDHKRNLCLWLEEALCNVGKHAEGVTQIQVTGIYDASRYTLKVQDNGRGLDVAQTQQGTHQGQLLAELLGGTFRREALPQGGVLCELSWPVKPLPSSL